jgi:hypothetical protein
MKNYFEKNKEENFESMDSIFTPIGRADLKKSKFEEVRRRSLKKPKIYEVED